MEYIKTDAKMWIFGDSFTGMYYESESWYSILFKKFCGNDIYVSSDGSRDIQTVIDIFLKNLHNIKENDFVILMLPTINRFRLPLATPNRDVEHESKILKYYDNLFIGNNRYSSIIELENVKNDNEFNKNFYNSIKLESPLCNINPKIFNDVKSIANTTDLSFYHIISMINSSKASLTNYNQILKSFSLHFKFNLKIYSWTDELDSSVVDTKSIIIDKCGEWHTKNDVWKETNGEQGVRGDAHWSKKMDGLFAQMIIKEHPKYFNN